VKLTASKNLQTIRDGKHTYIYNSLFGNLLKATEEDVNLINFFKSGNTVEDAKRLYGTESEKIEELRKRMFLIEEGFDEREFLKKKITEGIEKNIDTGALVYKLQLLVTTNCNLACAYCFRNKVIDPLTKEHGKMNFQVARKAMDGFLDITRRNKKEEVYVKFLGGEPLLNWNLIENLVLYVDSLGVTKPKINYILCTNGVSMNDSVAKILKEYNFGISISLDGVGETQDKLRKRITGEGTFKEIDRSIDILNEYENRIVVNAVLTDANLYHLRELIDYLYEKGIEQLSINTLRYASLMNYRQTASAKEKVEQLIDARKYGKEKGIVVGGKWFRLYKKTNEVEYPSYCRRMGEMLSVEPSGDVYTCSGLPIKVGNVEDMNAVFKSDEYRKIALRVMGNIPLCYGCEIEGMCAGGCTGNAYVASGDVYNPDLTECEFRKEITRRLILMEDWEKAKNECIQI